MSTLAIQCTTPFWSACILLRLLVPVLMVFLYFGLASHVFQLLGLAPNGISTLLTASLFGSIINIVLSRRRTVLANPRVERLPSALQRAIASKNCPSRTVTRYHGTIRSVA